MHYLAVLDEKLASVDGEGDLGPVRPKGHSTTAAFAFFGGIFGGDGMKKLAVGSFVGMKGGGVKKCKILDCVTLARPKQIVGSRTLNISCSGVCSRNPQFLL